MSNTVPVSPINAAPAMPRPVSVMGRVLVDMRGRRLTVIAWSRLSGDATAICSDSAESRSCATSIVTPGFSRPRTITVPAFGSRRPSPLFLKMSLTMVSNTPSGNQTSGEASAMVPPKPCGVTPTMVKSIELIFIVLPTSAGSKPVERHFSYPTITTGRFAPGRSSSGRNARPAASGTCSVSK